VVALQKLLNAALYFVQSAKRHIRLKQPIHSVLVFRVLADKPSYMRQQPPWLAPREVRVRRLCKYVQGSLVVANRRKFEGINPPFFLHQNFQTLVLCQGSPLPRQDTMR
jgi:hypothetical protein